MRVDPERWPSVDLGLGPVQLSWSGVFSGERRYGKAATVSAWRRAMTAAGFKVVEIGDAKLGAQVLTWSALDERPVRSGKSGPLTGPLDPTFVEARRAAETDPASTFARPRFRPQRPKGPVGSIRPV